MVALQNDRHSVAADRVAGTASTRRSRARKQRNADAPLRSPRSNGWPPGITSSTSARSSRSTRRSRTPCGAARSPMRWASRCSSSSTSGQAPSGRLGCTRSSGDRAVALVRRHRHRSRSAKRATTSTCLPPRDAEERLQREWGGEGRRAWDVIHSASFDHPLGGRGAAADVAVQPRSGAGRLATARP